MPKKSDITRRPGGPGEFLFNAHLDWQRATKKRGSIDAFAKYIGVTKSAMVKWMNDRVDTIEPYNVDKIAARCGPGIYDALGLPRPDPLLQVVIANWGAPSREQRDEISTWLGISTVGLLARPNNRVVADAISGQKAPARAPRSNGRAVKKHK